MFNETKKSMQWGGRNPDTGNRQGCPPGRRSRYRHLGETIVMANVTFAKAQKPGQDFFPLTVHYRKNTMPPAKFPAAFFKREARPTEKETLTPSDRPSDPPAVCPRLQERSSGDLHRAQPRSGQRPGHGGDDRRLAALTISGAPFMGPIAACRVGFEDGEYVLNPTVDDMHDLRNNPEQRLDLVVAGTKDAVMMVESEAYELSEAEMLGAVKFRT